MNIVEYTLIDCATGHSYGPFELVDRARHCAEVGNIAEWEIIDGYGTLVACQTGSCRPMANRRLQTREQRSITADHALIRRCH